MTKVGRRRMVLFEVFIIYVDSLNKRNFKTRNQGGSCRKAETSIPWDRKRKERNRFKIDKEWQTVSLVKEGKIVN